MGQKPRYMSRAHLRTRTFFMGFVLIAQGLVCILTFGVNPNWDFDFIAWDTLRWLGNRKKQKQEEGNNDG